MAQPAQCRSLVEPPRIIRDGESPRWDRTADVVVVGFGAAGAAAALQAREDGGEVLIVDRFEGGGASAYSGGVIYAGATRYQRESGVEDSVEETFKYLSVEMGGTVPERTLREYARESGSNLDWLAGHGVPFSGKVYEHKTILPPDGTYLYYAGNEKVAPYSVAAKPAPRGHKVVGSGMTGHVLFAALQAAVQRTHIDVLTHSPATRLVLDSRSRVVGVEICALPQHLHAAHQDLYRKVVPMVPFDGPRTERAVRDCRAMEIAAQGERRLIRARRGVVLATGGFQHNLQMVATVRPFIAANYRSLMRLGSMGNDGSGVELGQSAGADVALMDSMYLGRTLAPPNALLKGLLVNRQGARFVNEEAYTGFVGNAIAEQPAGEAWLLLRASNFWTAVRESLSSGSVVFRYYGLPTLLNVILGGTRRATSIRRLASKCGIDADGLEQTISTYNRIAAALEPDPLAKSRTNMEPFCDEAFYAVRESISNRFAFTHMFTLGGLTVDPDSGAVTRADGSSIPGLYAAGRVAVGLCSRRYVSGMSLSDCIFSGRRAARHAMVAARAAPAAASAL